MSAQQVQCQVLGRLVTGEVVDRDVEADAGSGPREIVTVDVGGSRYRVDADDIESR